MDGPKNVALANMQIVVGDFNGNGYVKLALIRDRLSCVLLLRRMDDVFLMSPTAKNSATVTRIRLLESKKGILTYREDDPFSGVGDAVRWTSNTLFFGHS